jgi:hypothetical protein
MLVADSRHEMTPVLNELARSCAPYASAATQQGVDYGKLPCTLYIYIRQLLVLNISLTPWWLLVVHDVGGGTVHQDPSNSKFTRPFLERLMQAGIKFRLLVRLSCVHRVISADG